MTPLRVSNHKKSKPGSFFIRGRAFVPQEIQQIVILTEKHFGEGRTAISIAVCEALDWRQPNGWLKDRACRDVLRQLDSIGIINLPPGKIVRAKLDQPAINTQLPVERLKLDTTPLTKLELSSIYLDPVKGTVNEKRWNGIVDAYHYLGFKCFVGRSMKYFIVSKGRILGGIGFTMPSWTIGPRDNLFKKLDIERDQIRERAINNGRFLILPWIKVPNLASKVLSLATKRVVLDWNEYYSIEPIFLETYVDPTRFHGTSYQAANWLRIGLTQGYKKSGSNHHNGQTNKYIYIYPINKNLRKQITKIIGGIDALSH